MVNLTKQQLSSPKAYLTYFIIAALLLGVVVGRYMASFATATFSFDTTVGSVTLTDNRKNTITPEVNTPIKLKKGTYTVMATGKNVAKNTYALTIDATKTYPIDFRYTDSYLQKLYQTEQLPIYTALLLAYPQINSDYTIHHDRLYRTGQWFGATLIYNDRKSDNRDTLHVLMKKDGTKWSVVSRPPEPILSKQTYPEAPYEVLRAINQAQ